MTQNYFAYSVAKKVFLNELSMKEGAEILHKDHKININSAKIMITVYDRMQRGLEFKRALSAPDMNYFLGSILAEEGSDALKNPIEALKKHIEYYEEKNSVNLLSLRKVYNTYLAINKNIDSIQDIEEKLNQEVNKARNISNSLRNQLLEKYPKIPTTKTIIVNIFERNPYVIAEVLKRANGKCERCQLPAPFYRKKDNTPYLEVHHKMRLADGGEDTVENAIAICPNCHREFHYG